MWETSLKLTSLIPKGESSRKVPYGESDAAAPSGASSRGGTSSYSNLSRQEHWRGLRRKKTRPEAPHLDAPQESATQESSAPFHWMGWQDWSGWKKKKEFFVCIYFFGVAIICVHLSPFPRE